MFSKWWLCYCQSILSLFFPYPTGDIKSQMDFVSSHWDILLLLANSDIHFPVFQSCPWDSNSRGREKDNKEKYQLSEGIISHMNFLLNFWYCVTISPRSFCMSDELISVYPREYRVRLLLCQSNCEFTKKKKKKVEGASFTVTVQFLVTFSMKDHSWWVEHVQFSFGLI